MEVGGTHTYNVMGAIVQNCVYLACRSLNIPRTLKDIAAACAQKRKVVARDYRLLLKELDVKAPVPDVYRMLSGIASSTGVSEKTRRTAAEILKRTRSSSAGKSRMGLAAAALYVACVLEGELITQKKIAVAADVTEATVRSRYKQLNDELTAEKRWLHGLTLK